MLAAKHCFNQNPADSYTKAMTYCKHVLPYVNQLLSSVFTLKRDSHHQSALKLYWEYGMKQLSNLPTNFKRIIDINFSFEQNTQIKSLKLMLVKILLTITKIRDFKKNYHIINSLF